MNTTPYPPLIQRPHNRIDLHAHRPLTHQIITLIRPRRHPPEHRPRRHAQQMELNRRCVEFYIESEPRDAGDIVLSDDVKPAVESRTVTFDEIQFPAYMDAEWIMAVV